MNNKLSNNNNLKSSRINLGLLLAETINFLHYISTNPVEFCNEDTEFFVELRTFLQSLPQTNIFKTHTQKILDKLDKKEFFTSDSLELIEAIKTIKNELATIIKMEFGHEYVFDA